MSLKVGDKVKIVAWHGSGDGSEWIGKVSRIKNTHWDGFNLELYTPGAYWTENELIKVKENTVSKAYKVIKETPAWSEGAIVVQQDGGDYAPIEDLWNNVEDNESYVECAKVVENAPEFFQRVYEMSKGKKAVYVTKEKAQEMASKFFEG